MEDRLCTNEQRMCIIDYLMKHRQSTRLELAKVFSVSKTTISRDIESICRYAPIYTRSGNNGGIYILPEFRHYSHYLSDIELSCLYRIMEIVENPDKDIILGIITKFVRNPAS